MLLVGEKDLPRVIYENTLLVWMQKWMNMHKKACDQKVAHDWNQEA